MNGVIYF